MAIRSFPGRNFAHGMPCGRVSAGASSCGSSRPQHPGWPYPPPAASREQAALPAVFSEYGRFDLPHIQNEPWWSCTPVADGPIREQVIVQEIFLSGQWFCVHVLPCPRGEVCGPGVPRDSRPASGATVDTLSWRLPARDSSTTIFMGQPRPKSLAIMAKGSSENSIAFARGFLRFSLAI
jgi:hypothetical protein